MIWQTTITSSPNRVWKNKMRFTKQLLVLNKKPIRNQTKLCMRILLMISKKLYHFDKKLKSNFKMILVKINKQKILKSKLNFKLTLTT